MIIHSVNCNKNINATNMSRVLPNYYHLTFSARCKKDEHLGSGGGKINKKTILQKIHDIFLGEDVSTYSCDDKQASLEILKMQQATKDWDEKHKDTDFGVPKNEIKQKQNSNVGQKPNITQQTQPPIMTYSLKTVVRTAKIEIQPKEIKSTSRKNNQTAEMAEIKAIPMPHFSFDYQELKSDLSEIDKVDSKWVEQNPQSVINIFNAASKGEGILQQAIEDCFLSPESKANAINQLLAKKDEFLKETDVQYSFEKQQYVLKVLDCINSTEDSEIILRALDKIQQYGTAEDLERINANVWMRAEEPLVVKLAQTTGQLGRKDVDDCQLIDYARPSSNLSCDAYIEVFKAVSKLSSGYTKKEYDYLIGHLNKIPEDKNGEFTEALEEMLIALGKKEYVSYLDEYLRNYGYVNEFKNKGQQTPQVVLDVIEKVRKGLEGKE